MATVLNDLNHLPTVSTGDVTPQPVPNPMITPIVGQNYVATATPTGTAPSAASVVNGTAQQTGYNPTQSATGLVQNINGQFAQPTLPGATAVTLDSLGQILNSGSPYITNAQRRGLETAGARGLMNSSVASGAATRAAIESSMPILNQAMGLNNQREGQDFQSLMESRGQAFDLTKNREQNEYQNARDRMAQAMNLTGQREQNAFTGQQSQLDRTQSVNNQLLTAELRKGQAVDDAKLQDWLNNQNYTRQFNGNLAMLPIQSAADLTAAISAMAIQDPELYTPEIVSGMTEFFNNNMLAILQQYFPGGG